MKKHILGLTIFSCIFASFVIVSAFFYAPPIPRVTEMQIEIDGRMETVGKGKASCFRNTEKDITYNIQSVQFDSDNDQFISKISATWKGETEPPKILCVATEVYALEQVKTTPRLRSAIFVTPFQNGKTADLVVKFNIPEYNDFDYRQNLYARFGFSPDSIANPNRMMTENVSDPQSVVYFHKTK